MGFQSRSNLYNPLVRLQSLSLSPKFEPLQVMWPSLQEKVEGLDCKINGQAHGAALQGLRLRALGWSDG